MKSILETLEDSGDFSTFVQLVKEAGMENRLTNQGPYTVFVPTDSAFARVSEERMKEITADTDTITIILAYHVVPGTLTSETLRTVETVRSLLGTELVIRSSNKGITVNGVPIVEADAFCDNGICHAIDAALMPPALEVTIL
ncbi:fasciclin [Methanoculleus taiwanensis]|uniref:Fasciclin n=1 Tax=Methanoculleus taiwanensis TaxID=1550565 RepID=A0A498H1J4_9EURY|nr:fasciclin domain-containing protein [Methanoculleus taiwanensis]RXE56237.1 fasciclin [Methanoculleus taiwanensis]